MFIDKDIMKILVISNNPERASFRQRIGIYFDILRENGIDCEVAKLPFGFSERLKLFRRARDFDGVFIHKKKLNILDIFVLRHYSRKIIYDFDDAVMFNPHKPQRNSPWHFLPFRRTVAAANLVIAGNQYLADYARKFNHNVEVLLTGLETEAYQIKNMPTRDGKIRLVWIGSSATLSYLEEIRPALDEIGKRFDNVVLRIICDKFFDLKNMMVEKCPWSLEKQSFDLATCDIGLSPLPDNHFTRGKCGFKILQYAASGLPVVASPVGVNRDYVQDGINGFCAVDNQQWFDKISLLIKDETLRKKMAAENLIWVKNFDLQIIGKKLVDLIKKNLSLT